MRGDHCRLDPIINKANKKQKGRQLVLKKGAEANTLEWPCVAPFSPASENASYGIAVSSDKEKQAGRARGRRRVESGPSEGCEDIKTD